jgi:hypothetical protein
MRIMDPIAASELENKRRIMRKLRAGLHGPRVDDTSDDVVVRDLAGRPNGNDPRVESRTLADIRADLQATQPREWP